MTYRDLVFSKTNIELAYWLSEEVPENNPGGTDWSVFPNFKAAEFVCPCGKCNYSTPDGVKNMDYRLLFILQAIRNKFGSVAITCGARCQEFNDSLKGSIQNSEHIQLKAADFYIKGKTSTESGREEVLAYAKKLPGYKYGYHNKAGKYPQMGSAVHINV